VVGVQHARYEYSCCQDSDLGAVHHPGEAVTLHWIVTAAPPTGTATAVPVTSSAVLTGPFPDVSTLKTAMEYPVSYTATLRQILGNEGSGGTDDGQWVEGRGRTSAAGRPPT